MTYTQHPLSAAFPSMEQGDYEALVADIRQHGQRDTASLYDGMVIDGWHRYRACEELEIPCRFEEFTGVDAVAFVRSKNQHRRHYQKSQQAAIEVSLTEWAVSHRPNKVAPGATLLDGDVNKGAPGAPLSTNKEMADRAGTGERTIVQAKRAHEAGLGEIVRDGKLSAKQAAEIAKSPDLAQQVAKGETTPEQAVEQITGKRPGAKAEKPAEKEEEYNPDDPANKVQELAHALQDSAKEVNDLTALVKSLEANDGAAEIAKLHERILGLEGRLYQEITTKNECMKSVKYYKGILDKILKKLGVEKYGDIMGALK